MPKECRTLKLWIHSLPQAHVPPLFFSFSPDAGLENGHLTICLRRNLLHIWQLTQPQLTLPAPLPPPISRISPHQVLSVVTKYLFYE